MASKHEIEIVIAPNGDVKLDVKGLKGPTCLTVIKKIADQVGEIVSTNLKGEYYEKPQTGTNTQQKQG